MDEIQNVPAADPMAVPAEEEGEAAPETTEEAPAEETPAA